MLPILIFEVIILVSLSAVCSGLNIALMSLQMSDLKRQVKLGNIRAKRVLPLRKNSNLTLASILFGNVVAISASSLVLDQHFKNGIAVGLGSSLLLVVFGEILPQAWFARNALAFSSLFAPFLKILIILTYPISKPMQLLLDKLLGSEAAHLHTRRELGVLIGEHLANHSSELDEDEIEIMRGALTLSEKRVREIMTPISKVYWLTPDTLIDEGKIDEIKTMSWSRIPVFNTQRTECFGTLLMKDLVDIDFDEHPYRVDELVLHPTTVVGSMTALDTMFRKFISVRSHLIPIERNDKIVGIVTIEDLIEEILGHEIEDESDHLKSRHPA